jgi:murein DD-endopeptidase MepM/ murein hydrolase activator NlpD
MAQAIPMHGRMRKMAVMVPVALFCHACGQPAKVVLYEQRQQMAQRGVRDVQAPVPRAKPLAAYPSTQARTVDVIRSPAARSRPSVEVSALPPPPPNRPGRAPEVASEPSVTTTPETSEKSPSAAVGPAPGVTTARSYERTAEAPSPYDKIPADGVHVVTPKQTVYALSRLYGVPVRSLLVLNNLEPPYLLTTGQKVKIPVQRTHMVSKGETVYAISRRYDVSLTELVRLNEVQKPFTIVTGQTLLLPDVQRTDVATAATSTGADEASGDADEPANNEQIASMAPPAAKRVVLPPSTNIPQPKMLSVDGFLWPVSGKVISRFGVKGKGLRNDGINIAAPTGAPIRAAQNGVIAYRGNQLRGFGNLILIKHDKGYMTAYAHASQILVERGARVKRGDVIAKVGNTGSVAGPQLHFEIRRGRQPIDPMRQLRAELTAGGSPKS